MCSNIHSVGFCIAYSITTGISYDLKWRMSKKESAFFMENRQIYIDYLKAFAICLVVLLHSGFVPFDSTLIAGTYSVCVPIFFMVNGYLMLRKERNVHDLWGTNLKLLCMIVIWSLILSSSRMLITREFSGSCKESTFALLKHCLYLDVEYCNILWFLQALFVLNALNPIFYAFIHRQENNVWYLVLILGAMTIQIFDYITNKFLNPIMWYPQKYSFLYYVLGYALLSGSVPHVIKDKLRSLKHAKMFLYIGIIVSVLMHYLYIGILQGPLHELNNGKQWMTNNIVWNGYGSFFIILLTSLICITFQQTNWISNQFWTYVGKISLPIYLVHTVFLQHIDIWFQQLDWYVTCRFFYIILPIIAFGMSVMTTWCLMKIKYTSWLIKI